ncbi:5-methyltetrahydrofolate--homocysteine methyltransferase [Desulfacinum hydrothermale DSM 13146]|uniref:5-methyltetrahydrofolate--homocysteine methyltransferase n=1 Tax=Desulfacinum hydrothermale DSM 13146 TaxID=1121390 RepID=A0A1W1X7V9_9BACT|nr:methyltetrahydrofolate cobalamin methyltransferase [Desulfacinum hydrothermale]SMC20039.1 5-methyltetrahydrofolate--homocysteine methyltransferase [Desulfacinum hydrothermale DSM 13146]
MLIVGELINASRKAISKQIETRDETAIRQVARNQLDAGAHYIDVNAGVFVGQEGDYLKWLVSTVQQEVEAPCCIDSPDPEAIEQALSVHRGTPMINSISLEKERYDKLMPLIAGTDFKVIALCMSDEGMPETAGARLANADKLVNRLLQNNVRPENIYVDPLVQPVSVNKDFGMEFLRAVEGIMTGTDGIHTICGLSNVSFGLPNRPFLNQTFMVMAIARGLDAAILNPLDRRMMAGIVAAEALAGRDEYCMNYLKAHRAGQFDLK